MFFISSAQCSDRRSSCIEAEHHHSPSFGPVTPCCLFLGTFKKQIKNRLYIQNYLYFTFFNHQHPRKSLIRFQQLSVTTPPCSLHCAARQGSTHSPIILRQALAPLHWLPFGTRCLDAASKSGNALLGRKQPAECRHNWPLAASHDLAVLTTSLRPPGGFPSMTPDRTADVLWALPTVQPNWNLPPAATTESDRPRSPLRTRRCRHKARPLPGRRRPRGH